MNDSTPKIIAALVICILALAVYGAYTTIRIRQLEQRLITTNERLYTTDERLQKIEASLKPRFELIGSNGPQK